ncbi:hypothetical protein [Streptomyces sp. NPDC090083]|uniref:hypothetical protein n=1 Tax=Streptomyces sp. NPDC090083 TaxID=3365941 RepID=UPI00381984FD
MSDEEIVMVYRGLDAVTDTEISCEEDDLKQNLINRLCRELGDLATRDWERVKNLVSTAAQSENEIVGCFAVDVAAALVRTNYEFARDTLVALDVARDDRSVQVSSQFCNLFQSGVLTPEQAADLEARLEAARDY